MLFNSIQFLLFFPIVVLIYFLIPASKLHYRNAFLLVASYYFYMNWEPAYALLLFTSTLVTYLAALGISYAQAHKKLFLTLSLIINLSILFAFKYFNFIGQNITILMQSMHIEMSVPTFDVLLPVGISFYIFQALGYSIDVYRNTTPTEKNFLTYALFVSFFPQLVAGPIERSNNLLPQFKTPHTLSEENVKSGVKMMIWGYFIKLVIAD